MNKEQASMEAERIVCRWYSISRHLPVENPNSISALIVGIAISLIRNKKYNKHLAQTKAETIIKAWADECDGLDSSSIYTMEVLEKRISGELESYV